MIARFKLSAAHWDCPEMAVHTLRAKATKNYADWAPAGVVTVTEVVRGGQAYKATIVLQKEVDW